MPRQKKPRLKRQKDGYFYAKFQGKSFKGRTEAEALHKKDAYKELLRSEGEARENPTVEAYSSGWLRVAKAGASVRTRHSTEVHINHLNACIGNLLVREVRPSDVKQVYARFYLNASDSYIKHAYSVFSTIFRSAVEDGLIHMNPAALETAKPHKGRVGSHRAITPDERWAIENLAIDHPMHTAAIIMLYAGLRPQEVKALRMDDIDTVIHVRRFVHVAGSNRYVVSAVGKTERSARDVPVFPPVAEAVKGKSGLILGGEEIATPVAWRRSWESYCRQLECAINGVQRRWYGRTREQKALLAEGLLPPWKPFTVTPYDLRHSFCSWCRDNGVELHTVVDWMGHADATMVLRIYDEVSSERNQVEAEKLKQAAFRLRNGLPGDSESS